MIASFSLFGDEEATEDISFQKYPTPWFTGPLIAPSAFTVKPGHVVFQPYLSLFTNVGRYGRHWNVNPIPNFYDARLRVRLRVGATNWLDVQLNPEFEYKETKGKHSAGIGDTFFGLNFQLFRFGIEDPWPTVRLSLATWIPSGKYEKLNPKLFETDRRGTGSWYPEVSIAFSKLWYLWGLHYFEARFHSGYRVGVPTSIKGLSYYGGDAGTRGTAYPGNVYFADLAFQFNLSQNWALASDFYYWRRDRSRFSGHTTEPATLKSTEQLSIAPALEYNFSKTLGLIGGVWFTYAGRNSPQFIRGILSLSSYF